MAIGTSGHIDVRTIASAAIPVGVVLVPTMLPARAETPMTAALAAMDGAVLIAWREWRCAKCGVLLARVHIVPGSAIIIRCRRCGLDNELAGSEAA